MQLQLIILTVVATQINVSKARPKSWREGPIVDPGVFVITQIKECRNRMGYCILGTSCNVDTDFVPDDLGGHCNRLSEAFSPKATFVCCKQNPELFEEDPSDNLEAIILEHNVNHPTAAASPAEGPEDDTKNEEKSEEKEEDSKPVVTVTELITELYTETDTTVDDITKVVTQIVTELVNVTGATTQEAVTNKIDFSTGSYTVTEQSTSTEAKPAEKEEESSYFLPSIGGSVLDSLPPVLESGPWIERPIIPSWDDLEEEDKDGNKQAATVEEDLDNSDSESVNEDDNGWSDTFTWNDENKEVYEIEIEQSIPGANNYKDGSITASGSVLRPGVVIDDPLIIQSIVQQPEANVPDYVPEEVVYSSDDQNSDDFLNNFSAFGTVEEVPVIEYSDYYPVVSYDENANLFEEYNDIGEPAVESLVPSVSPTPSSSEPEIHCDLSILLSGISCTFNILDEDDEGKESQPSPLQFAQDSKSEESGLLEVDPPSLPWTIVQESLTVNDESEDTSVWMDSESKINETTMNGKIESENMRTTTTEDILENDVDFEKLEEDNSTTEKIMKDQLAQKNNDTKKITEIQSESSEVEMEDNEVLVEKEVRHVVNHLDKLQEDAELIQILIDQLNLFNNETKDESQMIPEVVVESSSIKVNLFDPTPETGTVKKQNILPATALDKPKEKVCGIKGGQYVEKSYGKAASKYILPLLIDSWVYGKDKQQKARFDDIKGRISGGQVTSTVLYCWVAAITTEDGEFICTGSLVADDLVVTSGSCINYLFKRDLSEFKVVLGDSNLKLDLPYGVQEHKISKAIVHENYDSNDVLHHNDIGIVILRSPARIEENVCLLCLPRPDVDIDQESCTVTGFGRPTISTPLPRAAAYWEDKTTDGILREAELNIVTNEECATHLPGNKTDLSDFVCASSDPESEEEQSACYVGLDGGSPLACQADGHHYLGGIVIFSTVCGGDTPSVFLKISNYVQWLLENYATLRH